MNKKIIRDYLPLIVIFALITAFTFLRQFYLGFSFQQGMRDFMGAFFIIFGLFKIINWHGFAQAYATYDIIAKRSKTYAYAYPLFELALGVAYFLNIYPAATNMTTLILMTVSSIGVAIEVAQQKPIICACLGVFFKVPLTYVTLFEDLLMAFMALIMLLIM